MTQQELILVLAGIVIFSLSIYILALKIRLWFIGRVINLVTFWIPKQEKALTFGNNTAPQTDFGGIFILLLWLFNILGLYWILSH